MKLVQVENNQIVRWQLPKTEQLKDGRSVSGYDLLMLENPELAKDEGWLPLEDNPPECNSETQHLISDGYTILEDKVVKKYKIEDVPEPIEPEPSELDLVKVQNQALIDRQDFLEDVITEMILTVVP